MTLKQWAITLLLGYSILSGLSHLSAQDQETCELTNSLETCFLILNN